MGDLSEIAGLTCRLLGKVGKHVLSELNEHSSKVQALRIEYENKTNPELIAIVKSQTSTEKRQAAYVILKSRGITDINS